MTSCPFLAAQGVPASVLDCLLQECLLHGHAPNTDCVVTKSEKEQNISRKVRWKPTIELPTYRNGTRVCTRKTSGCSTSGFNQTVCYCCSEHSLQICSKLHVVLEFRNCHPSLENKNDPAWSEIERPQHVLHSQRYNR